MWYPYSWGIMGTVPRRLLPVRNPVPDVRHRDCIPLPVGCCSCIGRYLRIGIGSLFPGNPHFRPGLRLAERSVGMELKKRTEIRSMEYEDFKNNDYLERLVQQLNQDGAGIILGTVDELINWGRSNSLWSLTFGTSCCAIEFMALGAARYDMARFGFEVTRNSPRQADMIMVLGTITYRMAPVLKRLYDQMAEPKYVVAVGGCTISGGPFIKSYHVVNGIDKIIPVDVFIPGCPPRPEAFYYGMMQLQRKIKVEKFLGGVNRQEKKPEEKGEE